MANTPVPAGAGIQHQHQFITTAICASEVAMTTVSSSLHVNVHVQTPAIQPCTPTSDVEVLGENLCALPRWTLTRPTDADEAGSVYRVFNPFILQAKPYI